MPRWPGVRVAAMMGPVLLAALAAGCSTTTVQGRVDPERLAGVAVAGERAPAGVRIEVSDEDLSRTLGGQPLGQGLRVVVTMPVGELLQAAALAAFRAEFAGPVEPAAARAADAAPATGPTVRVAIRSMGFGSGKELVYFVPLGPVALSRTDVWVWLAFEVHVLDADGKALSVRSYDSGRAPVHPIRTGDRPWMVDSSIETNVPRVAHEQAMRLMQLAARDVRTWLDAELRRERVL